MIVPDAHFQDCPWWNDEACTCAERTLTPEMFYAAVAAVERQGERQDTIEPFYYSCGANYCDDPACIMNRPNHPEFFGPHPEVL